MILVSVGIPVFVGICIGWSTKSVPLGAAAAATLWSISVPLTVIAVALSERK